MSVHFHDFVGFLGILMIIGAYFGLQAEKIRSEELAYSIINAVGALCVLYSILFEFNLSAFLIETFWVLISGIGIVRYFMKKRTASETAEARTDG